MKKLLRSYFLCFVFCFMLFIYEPIIMYATNIDDFWFDLGTMIVPVIKIFLIFLLLTILMVSILYFINKLLSKTKFKIFKNYKLFEIIILIGFVLFFVTYIQGNYLIGNLPPLDGSSYAENKYIVENVITLSILLIISLIVIISCKKINIEKTIKYTTYISLAILVMLSISLLTTLISNKAFITKDGTMFSTENINDVSLNKNFYIYVLDTIDSREFYETLNENMEYKDLFNDFTYYPDTLSTYAYTRDSIPQILTGEVNDNEKNISDYSTDALNNSPLFEKLQNQQYDMNIYDLDLIWNGQKKYEIKNVILRKNSKINLFSFFKQELKYVLFKYVPYGLKKYSKVESIDFNLCTEKFLWGSDIAYNNMISNPKMNILDNNQFQFIHIEGAHPPFDLDRNLNRIDNGTFKEKILANINVLSTFINRLKSNGVYDNSAIIILADHGYSDVTNLGRYNPILLIKGTDEKHEMKISNLPISYGDLMEAYLDLLDGKKSTELFKNISKNRTRNFIWYNFNKEDYMVEYVTNGKAWEIDKFKKTGKIFER